MRWAVGTVPPHTREIASLSSLSELVLWALLQKECLAHGMLSKREVTTRYGPNGKELVV